MNNPITVYCDKDLVFKYVRQMPESMETCKNRCSNPCPCFEYESALQKAKDEANNTPFENQKQIADLIFSNEMSKGKPNQVFTGFKPDTFYQIDGEVEVVNKPIPCPDNKFGCTGHDSKVARLKESKREENGEREWVASPKKQIPLEVRLENLSQKLKKSEKQVKSLQEPIMKETWGEKYEALEMVVIKMMQFVPVEERELFMHTLNAKELKRLEVAEIVGMITNSFPVKESLPVQEESENGRKWIELQSNTMWGDVKDLVFRYNNGALRYNQLLQELNKQFSITRKANNL